MKRRGFIAVLGGAAAWSRAGLAQQPELMRRVGVLIAFPENNPNAQAYVSAFTQALERLGWVDGKNIRIDYRFAAGDPKLFKTYASELVSLTPDAILASTAPAVVALRQQTSTIPIVFVIVPDPVGLGLVQSLARPGGNISSWDAAIIGKWAQFLKEVAPSVTQVAAILNPATAFAPSLKHEIEAAASSLGIVMKLAPVHDDAEIEDTIAAQAREPGGALACLPDPFIVTHLPSIIAAALRHRVPSVGFIELARSGGLMSYWYNPPELHAQAASYIDRILKGASPADLPVQQPTKYSLIINLKTAKALGLTVPQHMLQIADEVIE
jgi:putative ABC transport system substrate-binding protein